MNTSAHAGMTSASCPACRFQMRQTRSIQKRAAIAEAHGEWYTASPMTDAQITARQDAAMARLLETAARNMSRRRR